MSSPHLTGLAARAAARPRRGRRLRLHHPAVPYLLCAPYVILLVAFVLWPAAFGVWMSLHDWDFMLPNKPFIGLDNYLDLFDPMSRTFQPFWDGMIATGIFTVASVPLLLAIPLGLAIMLHRRFPGRTFFRAVIFAPYVLGIGVVGVLFNFLLDSRYGLVNALTSLVGIPPVAWTQTQPAAWVGLVAMTVWWTLGFNTVIYLAGLQNVPAELYESAEIDGAGAWSRFRHVTLPGLRSVLVFVVTMTLLASANMFGQSYLVTGGGPGTSTRTAIMVMTEEGLRSFRMGSATAMSYILALVLAIVSIINFLVLRERKR